MRFEEHCYETMEVFGESYDFVHRWLDEFHADPAYGPKHRKKRHHLQGVAEAARMWGAKAAGAAILHILSDLKDEYIFDPSKDLLPADEAEYVKMGLH